MPMVGPPLEIGFNPQMIKFAMIGQYGIENTDIEWPTPKDLEQFPRKTRIQLKEIRYKMNSEHFENQSYRRIHQITALQFFFTGDVCSPIFKLKGTKEHEWQSVHLNLEQNVKQCDMNMTTSGCITRWRLKDEEENDIFDLNTRGQSSTNRLQQKKAVYREIPEGFEIIGMYAIMTKDRKRWFKFGFILWKPDPATLNQK